MGVQVTRDLFRRYDPLEFDPEKVDAVIKKHGIRPHFCNQKWRDDRRGWGTLDPLEASDPRFADVYDCLCNKPRDPKRRLRDGYYRQGDQVLSFQKIEEWEISQARRDYLANRRAQAMRDGNPVRDQLQLEDDTENIEVPRPYIRHVNSKGEDQLGPKSGPGSAARGFVTMNAPEAPVPVMAGPEPAPVRKTRKGARKKATTRKRVARRSKT